MAAGTRQAVFVHGGGGGGWEWAIWQAVFAARGWQTRAPDLQPVAAGLAATGLADYRDQVQRWLAESTPPPVLIGASLGGLLALLASQRSPCAALLLINPLPPAPMAERLPAMDLDAAVVPWRRQARLASSRRALRTADDASALYAFRRWRDESSAVLREARAGLVCRPPSSPTLVLASRDDNDVPCALSRALAEQFSAECLALEGDHLEPLMGRTANRVGALAVDWLNAALEFRSN